MRRNSKKKLNVKMVIVFILIILFILILYINFYNILFNNNFILNIGNALNIGGYRVILKIAMISIWALVKKKLQIKMSILQLLLTKKIIRKHIRNINKMVILLGVLKNIWILQWLKMDVVLL